MRMIRMALIVCATVVTTATHASAQGFFNNFLKPEYLIPVGEFPASSGGDLLVTYYQVQIPAMANGELLVLGEFPRARYFSVTAYDDHGAVTGKLDDFEIQPYGSSVHPYRPGGPAGAEDILYALTVRIGTPGPPNPLAQCQTPLSVHENVLDASIRHTASTYYSSEHADFSAVVPGYGTVTHIDAPATTGLFLIIRVYTLRNPLPSSQVDLRKPLVWLRAASTGCAVQLAPAGQMLQPSQWFTMHAMLHLDQVFAHVQREADLGTDAPYGLDPRGEIAWSGREEYQPGHAAGRYLTAILPLDPPTLKAQGRVLQMQYQLPAMPCRTALPCTLTGDEELRYWSLTFEDAAGKSLGSLFDLDILPDADGYVTLVVSLGSTLPPHVTPANGYSPIVGSLQSASRLVLRSYLPAASFGCGTDNVPARTAEYHPNGGYMGEYAPVVTFPTASSLPEIAQPANMNEVCAAP